MPLSGIHVADLTRILAGPFGTMLLGDMGAEVIKIETPGEGDPVRRQGAIRDGLSRCFAAFNRNKRSPSFNLRHEEVEHPGRSPVRMLGFPLEFAEAPCRVRGPAPELGGDTEAILRELGYAPKAIARRRAAGIV
jgi:crotonobetainyl-CoA:carnitine CoA-transferase CaiB-like acyl-CoA transferase